MQSTLKDLTCSTCNYMVESTTEKDANGLPRTICNRFPPTPVPMIANRTDFKTGMPKIETDVYFMFPSINAKVQVCGEHTQMQSEH